ncbi:MAG: reverse transcriptase domain-containing protein [Methylococcales bacterium]
MSKKPVRSLQSRDKGSPQGSVISPLLANLFLHYAFDRWMAEHYPEMPFERYTDDSVCHCVSLAQAQRLRMALEERFRACGLDLHPEKTKIVCPVRMMIEDNDTRTRVLIFSGTGDQ